MNYLLHLLSLIQRGSVKWSFNTSQVTNIGHVEVYQENDKQLQKEAFNLSSKTLQKFLEEETDSIF
jgi:hypothetical protein